MGQILDGARIRDQILAELRPRIAALPRPPGLAVVLVGDDPASEIYVRNKVKACHDLGLHSVKVAPPASITTAGLIAAIDRLNQDPAIDGILVQMPLPPHIDSRAILEAVAADKDADGFHPLNVGHLVANRPAPRSCTPAGILESLKRHGVAIAGRRAVVLGRSDIVGKPMALMLLHEHATVTICHSRTSGLAAICREADILVAAIGKPAFVTEEFIREGAVVVDVGINRVADPAAAARFGRQAAFEKHGSFVVGDVDPLAMARRAGAYTPVPGGVGPLTIAMLMSNTVWLGERHCSASA